MSTMSARRAKIRRARRRVASRPYHSQSGSEEVDVDAACGEEIMTLGWPTHRSGASKLGMRRESQPEGS